MIMKIRPYAKHDQAARQLGCAPMEAVRHQQPDPYERTANTRYQANEVPGGDVKMIKVEPTTMTIAPGVAKHGQPCASPFCDGSPRAHSRRRLRGRLLDLKLVLELEDLDRACPR